MKDHIRREAAKFGAGWWLVPIAFAAVAFVAVATIDPEAQAQRPLAAPPPAAVPAVTQPSAPAEAPVVEVTEHVQAF